MRDTALGGLNTTTKMAEWKWKAAHIALSPARGAFLALVRLNIWGLATLFSQKLFFVSDAVTATQSEPNYWWDLGSKMAVGWHNLGGKWDGFKNAVNAGKNKKARGFALAPKAIKDKFAAQGITGQGIGVLSEATISLIVLAGSIVIALVPLLVIIIQNSNTRKMLEKVGIEDEKDRESQAAEEALRRLEAAKNRQFELDRIKAEAAAAEGEGFSFTDADGKVTTAGYGIIGAGVLGMLFLGTMKKNKSKK